MVFIKLTAQEKHTWKHSKYVIQAYDLATAESDWDWENPSKYLFLMVVRTRHRKNTPYLGIHPITPSEWEFMEFSSFQKGRNTIQTFLLYLFNRFVNCGLTQPRILASIFGKYKTYFFLLFWIYAPENFSVCVLPAREGQNDDGKSLRSDWQ